MLELIGWIWINMWSVIFVGMMIIGFAGILYGFANAAQGFSYLDLAFGSAIVVMLSYTYFIHLDQMHELEDPDVDPVISISEELDKPLTQEEKEQTWEEIDVTFAVIFTLCWWVLVGFLRVCGIPSIILFWPVMIVFFKSV